MTRKSARIRRQTGKIEASINPGTDLVSMFKVLSDVDITKIHQASLELLSKVGIASPTPRVVELAKNHGCKINQQGRLLFSCSLVEDMIDKACKQFVVYGRDSAYDFEARNGRVNFCTGGAAVSMLDIDQREYRPSTLADLYDLSRLCDTLENIQWFTRPVVATDIADLFELDINTVYACAAGTQKHIATSITQGEHVYRMLPLLDLLADCDGGFKRRPFCTVHATTIVSPLTFATDSLEGGVCRR